MRAMQRISFACAAILLLAGGVLSCREFLAQYYTVEAQSAGSREQHHGALARALEFEPEYNWASLLMARLMLRTEAYGGAQAYQRRAMRSYCTIGAIEQMGSIQKRLGNHEDARNHFQKAARVNPGNVRALTQLALLAYETRNLGELEQLTADILRHDLGNLDAHYLRAAAAERGATRGRRCLSTNGCRRGCCGAATPRRERFSPARMWRTACGNCQMPGAGRDGQTGGGGARGYCYAGCTRGRRGILPAHPAGQQRALPDAPGTMA